MIWHLVTRGDLVSGAKELVGCCLVTRGDMVSGDKVYEQNYFVYRIRHFSCLLVIRLLSMIWQRGMVLSQQEYCRAMISIVITILVKSQMFLPDIYLRFSLIVYFIVTRLIL